MCRFVFEFEMNWRMEDYESAGLSFEKACQPPPPPFPPFPPSPTSKVAPRSLTSMAYQANINYLVPVLEVCNNPPPPPPHTHTQCTHTQTNLATGLKWSM